MSILHYCKTRTRAECDPSRHPLYERYRGELLHQKDTLEEAQRRLADHSLNIIFHKPHEDFSLPLYKNVFGLYLCDVDVNGVACRFVIDTGAQLSSIRYDMMVRLGISNSNGSIEVGAASGTRKKLKGCVLRSLAFGQAAYENVPVLCLDKHDFSLRFADVDIFRFDGILGWDILRNFDFELDTVAMQLKFMKNRFRFAYENMVSGLFPIFLAEDERGNLLKMGFDSGSKHSWFSMESAERLRYVEHGEITAVGFGVHGAEKMHLHLYKDMRFSLYRADIHIHNMMSGNCNILPEIVCDGVFGNEIFRNRRIRLINSKGMVLLA